MSASLIYLPCIIIVISLVLCEGPTPLTEKLLELSLYDIFLPVKVILGVIPSIKKLNFSEISAKSSLSNSILLLDSNPA